MATPSTSVGTYVAIGEESTWATAVSRNRFFEATAADIKHEVVRSEVPVMTNAGSGSYNATETYDGVTKVTGSFTVPVTYTSLGMLLKHALRKTPTTTGPSGSDYTHTYKLQRDAPTGGLTIEWVIGATGITRVAEGCRVTKLTISGKTGDLVYASVEFIGQTSSAGTPTSPTFSRTYVTHLHGSTLSWNSRTLGLRAFSFVVDHGLEGIYEMGSGLSLDMPVAKLLSVTGSFEIHGLDADAITEYQAKTSSTAVVTMTSGSSSMTISGHNGVITADPVPTTSGPGVLVSTIPMRFLSNGTNEGIALVIVNTQSSATA